MGVGWARGRAACPGALTGWPWALHRSPAHGVEGLGPSHVTGICTPSPLASDTARLPQLQHGRGASGTWENILELAFEFYLIDRAV